MDFIVDGRMDTSIVIRSLIVCLVCFFLGNFVICLNEYIYKDISEIYTSSYCENDHA